MSTKYSFSEFNYCKDDKVFKYPEAFHHSYSDGSHIENKIYDILKNSKDNSIFSKELSDEIDSWVTEYHFSSNRHNLLRHIDFSNKTFLELGAGCGALTRYVGEKAKTVVGIEGSILRAKCASQRCRDLENVKIYCANFNDVIPEEKFDFVSLIGVLEYASVYTNSATPFEDCLKMSSKFLKEDGKLIIAIENRLGLKYFSGLSEDHISKSYYGLYDFYKKNTAKTFGKFELIELLMSCGLNNNEFFYPFPDYKLPTVILTEQSLKENINLSNILFRIVPRDYLKKNSRKFYDNLVWSSIEKNKLIDQFSNSFLVIAGWEREAFNQNNLIYQYTTNRKNKYNITTKFKKKSKSIIVSKELILENIPQVNNAIINHKIESEKYIYGSLLEKDISKAIVAERMDDLVEYLNSWLKYLFDNAIVKRKDNVFLSEIEKDFFDCIPQNIIVKNEEYFYIDREWELKNGMTLYMLLLRYFMSWGRYKIDFIDKYFSNNKSYLVNLFQLLKIPIIMDEFKKFELLTKNVYSEIIKDDYKFNLNYKLLKNKKYFFLKKVVKKIIRLIRDIEIR